MMKLAKGRFATKRERQLWVYGEHSRMYPAPEPAASADSVRQRDKEVRNSNDGSIRGLNDIPGSWPELPATASIAADVGWVQSNRLAVIEDKAAGPTLVHRGQARSPAPSWAALGWLETSIRNYAKFVDVAAKATASDDGEAEVWRHERIAIEEVRALLDEMRADG
jgi:hypothetical protein